MTEKSSDKLKLVRVYSFEAVPRYLLEQVKGRSWTPDKVYEWGEILGSQPSQLIYVMITPDRETKGVVWASVNPVVDGLFLNLVSVDHEYQDGEILQKVTGTLKRMASNLGLSSVYALTTRPRGAQRKGWTKTGQVMMEV